MGLITDAPEPVPPSRLATWFARPSSRLFAVALALATAAVALTLYQGQQQRAFAEPTTNSMGVVRSSSGKSTRRKGSSSEMLCWVSYEFSPAGGAAQRNWRFWGEGCSVSKGRPILIQYVIARPEVNRPAAENWSFPPLLIWFAAGVMVVIGTVVRVARE